MFLQTNAFRLHVRRHRFAWWRRFVLRRLGMSIGCESTVGRIEVNWPHQVSIGNHTSVGDGVVMDYCHGVHHAGPAMIVGDRCFLGRGVELNCRVGIHIGDDCLIAAGCRLIDHDHGMSPDQPMRVQNGPEGPIVLEDDVWLGVNVVVLKGVRIGRGAVVAAGGIVTKSVPSMEIWGGVPARRLGSRSTAAS